MPIFPNNLAVIKSVPFNSGQIDPKWIIWQLYSQGWVKMSDTFGINTPITWTCLKLPLFQGDDDIPVPQTVLSSQASVETTERKISFNWTLESCKLFFPTEHKRNFYIKRNCIGLNNFSFCKKVVPGLRIFVQDTPTWLLTVQEERGPEQQLNIDRKSDLGHVEPRHCDIGQRALLLHQPGILKLQKNFELISPLFFGFLKNY